MATNWGWLLVLCILRYRWRGDRGLSVLDNVDATGNTESGVTRDQRRKPRELRIRPWRGCEEATSKITCKPPKNMGGGLSSHALKWWADHISYKIILCRLTSKPIYRSGESTSGRTLVPFSLNYSIVYTNYFQYVMLLHRRGVSSTCCFIMLFSWLSFQNLEFGLDNIQRSMLRGIYILICA